MGAALSSAPTTRSSKTRLDRITKNIRKISNDITNQAIMYGWDEQNPTTCQRLKFFYKGLQQLNKEYLKDVNYQLGIIIGPEIIPEYSTQDLCQKIIDYYTQKIYLVRFIQDNVPESCQDRERIIYANLEEMLEGASPEERKEAYRRLDNVNELLSNWYYKIYKNLQMIQKDVTKNELDLLVKNTYDLLSDGFKKCCYALDSLRDFAWEKYQENEYTYYYNPYFDESEWQLPKIRDIGLSPERSITEMPQCLQYA